MCVSWIELGFRLGVLDDLCGVRTSLFGACLAVRLALLLECPEDVFYGHALPPRMLVALTSR